MAHCIKDTKYRWPHGVVPYTWHPDLDEAEVEQAVSIWNSANADVRFEPYTGPQTPPPPPHFPPGPPPRLPNFVRFVRGNEGTICRSEVGSRRPGQPIYCDPGSDTVIHEMGHALGLFHEQQRADRDQHVQVRRENIIESRRSDFTKKGAGEAFTFSAYDFDSVMHYSDASGAIDFTINQALPELRTALPPAAAIFGNRLHLVYADSETDLVHARVTATGTVQHRRAIPDQSSKAGASLATFGGALFLVHVGRTSDDVWISRCTDGTNFSANRRIPSLRSRGVPALAGFDGELHLVWTDTDSQVKHSWSTTGDPDDWSAPRAIQQTSKAAVALAATPDGLHLVHLGQTSSDLWYSFSSDGRHWTENDRIGQQSKTTPSLAAVGSTLHLVHLGASSNQIWHSRRPSGADEFTFNRETNQRSGVRPMLASGVLDSQSRMLLMHRGDTSEQVYLSRYQPDLVTMSSIDPDHPGGISGGSGISLRDAAAVRFMYR